MSARPLRLVVLGHSAELSGAELGLLELAAVFEDVELTVLLAEDGPLVPRLETTPAAVEVLPLHDGARRLQRDNVRVGRLAALPAAAVSAAYALRVGLYGRDGRRLPVVDENGNCLLYTSPSPRDSTSSRMPSSA